MTRNPRSPEAKLWRASLLAGILTGMNLTAIAASMLTTKDGLTVYTFDKDSPGKSVCKGSCASTWRPVSPGMMSGRVASIKREDGSTQATIDGKPIYLFAGDHKPGDKAGDGVLGVWHVVSGMEQGAAGSSSSSGSSDATGASGSAGSTGY